MSMFKSSKKDDVAVADIDEAALSSETETVSVTPEEGADPESDSSKLKVLLGVLKKVVGVKDLANLRLSLPANLLAPEGNLEYWHYLDRPDLFAAIGTKDIDPLTRFIAIVRWLLTKELRYVRGRVCKPYNSALGEQFRCVWEVSPASASDFQVYQDISDSPLPDMGYPSASSASTSSVQSSPALNATKKLDLSKSVSQLSLNDTASQTHKKGRTSISGSSTSSLLNQEGAVASRAASPPTGKCRVAFVNEQVCHHPPISAFWYESTPGEGRAAVQASGVDQIAAKFNGTSVKIGPGSQNQGIFLKVPDVTSDEYQIVHPDGYISGLLSAKPYISLSASTFVNTITSDGSGKGYRAIIQYNEDSWISKPKFLVEGVIYETDDNSSTPYTQIKKVPEAAVVARIKGTWRGKITIKRTKGDKAESTLVDMSRLDIVKKRVRPLEAQEPVETRRFWEPVTNSIVKKDYKQATVHKQAIEQAQRDKAAARVKNQEEFVPVFFDPDISSGRAVLTAKGRAALQDEMQLVGHAQ